MRNVKHIVTAIVYLGVGMLLHALLIGGAVDWSSAWSIGVIFGWPLLFALGTLALGLLVAVVACIAMLFGWL